MAFTLNPLADNSDLFKYEYFLQGDVCRLCWQRNSFREIANNTVLIYEIKVEVLAVIRECLEIDFCDVSYPNKVCEQCWETIKKFYSFRIYCKESDTKLRQIIDAGCRSSPPVEAQVKTELKAEISLEICEALDIPNFKSNKAKAAKSNDKAKKPLNYCYICCTEFDDGKKFTDHNSECHGIENGMYKCFGCDKKFKTMRSRTGHEVHFCKALKEGYKCSICNRLLPLRKSYEAHMRYHAGKENDVVTELSGNIFKCKKCDSSFKTKDSLKEHMATHNSIDNHFVCETCGRVFLRQDYLQKHLMIHLGVKRHVCTYCGQRFVQKSSLNVHLRKHTGERPFQCDLCPQRCVSSSNLRAHRRRHLGIKQFECAICGKKFGYKLSLAEHIASAHEKVKSHQCALCGALYTRRKELQRHAARKHRPKDTDAAPQIPQYVNQTVAQTIH